jgi:putative membrane protein
MLPFIYFATGTFLIMGILQIWRSDSKKDLDIFCDCGLDHNRKTSPIKSLVLYCLFLFPVFTGFLFPDVILDSSVVAKRGINLASANASVEQKPASSNDGNETVAASTDSSQAKSLDELYLEGLLNNDKIEVTDPEYSKIISTVEMNLEKFVGKEIELTGFVYREPDYKQDQMAISRFTVSCCVADVQVMGTLATGEIAKQLKNDEWVKVTGIIEKGERNGQTLPSIQIKNLEKIEAPSDPYIYIY